MNYLACRPGTVAEAEQSDDYRDHYEALPGTPSRNVPSASTGIWFSSRHSEAEESQILFGHVMTADASPQSTNLMARRNRAAERSLRQPIQGTRQRAISFR